MLPHASTCPVEVRAKLWLPPAAIAVTVVPTGSEVDTGTLLFVSHSEAEVSRLCTRAIWIEDGRIRAEGEPGEVIRAYHQALLVEKDDAHRFSAGLR